MKEEIIKAAIPEEWNLADSVSLKSYYEAIERTHKDCEILGFIKYIDGSTDALLRKN